LSDSTKAKEKLSWGLEVTFDEMIKEMVDSDLDQAKRHLLLKENSRLVFVAAEN
jgi:GDPmannose 4,6-dehydratase